MTKRLYLIWLGVGVALFCVVVLGFATLSQMALTTTGYVPPPPWPQILGMGVGMFAYWSALCWTLALLRRRPLVAFAIIGATVAVGVAYPIWDQARYRDQQARIAETGLIGIPPDWTGKKALLIWPREGCQYDCWNLALNMEADVVVLTGTDVRDVDFTAPVDLTTLPLSRMVEGAGDDGMAGLVPAQVDRIDHVIVHVERAEVFDGVFDDLRPPGIPRGGLFVDAMIVPVADQTAFDLGQTPPVLRLAHVSRHTATVPYLPFNGTRRYWNHADRTANLELAEDYFCSAEARDPHWCYNAFD